MILTDYLDTDIVSQLVRAIRRQVPPTEGSIARLAWHPIRVAAFFSLYREEVQERAVEQVLGMPYNDAMVPLVFAAWDVIETENMRWVPPARRAGRWSAVNEGIAAAMEMAGTMAGAARSVRAFQREIEAHSYRRTA